MDRELLIDKYLQGSLNQDEKILFDQLLSDEPSLKIEIEQKERLVQGIRLNHLEDKMSMLKKLEKEELSRKKPVKVISIFSKKFVSIAASLLLLGAMSIWLMNSGGNNNIYNEFYEFLPASEMVRGDDDQSAQFSKALSLYNSKEFDKAKNELDMISLSRALFYRGICHMELKEYNEAKELFISYIESQDPQALPAQFYLGLCYIKLGQEEIAKEYLAKVNQRETYFYNKAQALLARLK